MRKTKTCARCHKEVERYAVIHEVIDAGGYHTYGKRKRRYCEPCIERIVEMDAKEQSELLGKL